MTRRGVTFAMRVLGVAAAVILLASCVGGSPAANPAQQAKEDRPLDPPVAVKAGAISGIADAGLFIALDRGYFEEQGLLVELVNIDTLAQMVPLMATGRLDVGSGATTAGLFNAYNREIPMKIVADKGSTPKGFGYAALVIRKDLVDNGTIKDVADLKGKTIALSSKQSTPAIHLDRGLRKANLKIEDLNIVEMSFSDMIAAFANKSIDGAIQIEPTVTAALDRGLIVRWKGADELYPNSQGGVLMYAPSFHQNRPEAARRFMVAYVKALRDYNDAFSKNKGRAEVVSILAKYTPIKDVALYDRMVPAGLNPDGYVNKESIASDQGWYADHGYVKQKVDINELVDDQYADYVVKKLGKYR